LPHERSTFTAFAGLLIFIFVYIFFYQDGWKGIHFVEKVFESGKQGTWVKLDDAVTGRRPPM
jgi:hypothetical protein